MNSQSIPFWKSKPIRWIDSNNIFYFLSIIKNESCIFYNPFCAEFFSPIFRKGYRKGRKSSKKKETLYAPLRHTREEKPRSTGVFAYQTPFARSRKTLYFIEIFTAIKFSNIILLENRTNVLDNFERFFHSRPSFTVQGTYRSSVWSALR